VHACTHEEARITPAEAGHTFSARPPSFEAVRAWQSVCDCGGMFTARTRTRSCPVCQASATEYSSGELPGRTMVCSGGCGTYTIATRFFTELRAAWAGSGALAGELGNLSRALQNEAICELLNVKGVLADLREFVACERAEHEEAAPDAPGSPLN